MEISVQSGLLVNGILYFLGFVVMLFTVIRLGKRMPGLYGFVLYFLLNTIGVIGILYRGDLPDFITIVFSNYIMFLGSIFLVMGVLKFYGLKVSYLAITVISVIFITLFIYYTYVDFSVSERILVYGYGIIGLHGYVLYLSIKSNGASYRKINLFSFIVSLYLLVHITRMVKVYLTPSPNLFFEYSSDSILIVMMGALGSLISTGVLSLINSRLFNEVAEGENTLSNFIQYAPIPAMVHAEDGEIIYLSKVWTEISGYSIKEIPTTDIWIKKAYLENQEDIKTIIKSLYLNKDERSYNEVSIITKDGKKRIWSFHSTFIGILPDGRSSAMSVARDVTESRLSETAIKYEKNKAQMYLDIVGSLLLVLDKNGDITLLNKMGCEILGVKEEEIIGKNWFDHFVPKELVEEIKFVFFNIINNKAEYPSQYENEIVTAFGEKLIFSWYNSILHDIEGNITGIISSGIDITERRKYMESLKSIGYHDALTGLYNRRYYEENLSKLNVSSNYPITIIMGDINGLKLINDAFGHKSGDDLLISAANIITESCKESDLVARIGGDEFVVVMPNTSETEAEKVINKIHMASKSISIESIQLSISFGLKTKTNDEEDIQGIYRSAEDLMYREKLLEIPSMRSSAIETILKTLYEKDINSEIHSRTVSRLSERIARSYGMNRQAVAEARTAGLLHDIGKIIIPLPIINKKGKLTSSEYSSIKTHSEIGFRILNSTQDMRGISNIILCHHERWDGKGYPRGIIGNDIPVTSRIISIADAFDAMTSERTYRDIFSNEQALKEIIANSGTQFDPKIVEVFTNDFNNIVALEE